MSNPDLGFLFLVGLPIKNADGFDVVGVGENVDGGYGVYFPGAGEDDGGVSGEGGWVAGDVDDAVGFGVAQGGHAVFRAYAGGIEDDGSPFLAIDEIGECFVAADVEFAASGVVGGLDGGAVFVEAYDVCFFAQTERHVSASAVEVEN